MNFADSLHNFYHSPVSSILGKKWKMLLIPLFSVKIPAWLLMSYPLLTLPNKNTQYWKTCKFLY